jgi:3-oxoacyl-[acyl-carrier-protein] synthase-3
MTGLHSKIAGTGRALPPRVLDNHELASRLDTSDAWIVERTGIRERRLVADGQHASDLAAAAGKAALEAAGLDARQLDCIVVCTVTPDTPMPACAVHVQRKLDAGSCPAFDVSAACAGFVYGLHLADALVKTGMHRRVLVVGVEVLSRIVDWQDRNTCILFGDGAGAVVLEASSEPGRGLVASRIWADGHEAELLHQPLGGKVQMQGRPLFQQAVKLLDEACRQVLAAAGWQAGDVDLVVAHQANRRLVEALAQRTGLPLERFLLNIDRYGNTSAASIPIALDEAVRAGQVRPGQNLLFVALGAGLAWGAAAMRW